MNKLEIFLEQEKKFDYSKIRKHAQSFSESVFLEKFKSIVISEYIDFTESKL